MRTNSLALVVVAIVAVGAFGLKRHYAVASTDALSWMLTPTAQLVSVVTGVPFTAVPGEGYFSAERMFLIEKACAGVNFMIAAFAMVAMALLHRVRSLRHAASLIAASLLASYLSAIAVNAVRIVIAMWLAAHPPAWTSLTAAGIHRLEGIAVYFGGLLLLYGVVRWIDSRSAGCGYALPLACYFAVTLGLPLVNGIVRSPSGSVGDQFFAHAAIVLLVPPVLILGVHAVRRLIWRI